MRVIVERSGGFAGLRITRAVDSADLSPEKARELAGLVGAVEWSQSEPSDADVQRDRFQYLVTVENGGRRRRLVLSEEDTPAPLRHLIEWVIQASREKQGPS